MKVSMLRLTPILALTLACSRPAFGQGSYARGPHEWEATGFGGGSFLGNFQFPTPVSGGGQETFRTVGIHYASGYQIGVRINQNLDDFWAADLEYSFANQPLRFTNLSPDIQSLSVSHFVHHFSYNISYLPLKPMRRFRPYGNVGAGTALFYIPGPSRNAALALGVALRDCWKLALNWGGGFKYQVEDQVALTFDLKDQLSNVPSYGLPPSAQVINGQYLPGMAATGFMHNWQVNFGVSFQWNDE